MSYYINNIANSIIEKISIKIEDDKIIDINKEKIKNTFYEKYGRKNYIKPYQV